MKSFSIKSIFVFALLLGCASFAHSQQQKVKPSQRSFREEVKLVKEKQNKRQDYIRKMQASQMKRSAPAASPVMPPTASVQQRTVPVQQPTVPVQQPTAQVPQPKAPVSRQPMVMDKHQNPKNK